MLRKSVAVILAAVAACPAVAAFRIQTSLYDLVGISGGPAADLREGTRNMMMVIAGSDSPGRSSAAARRFVEAIPAEWKTSDDGLRSLPLNRLENRVSAEDAALLGSAEGRAKIAKRAIRRYVASPMPPLFDPEDDPFCLKEHFAMTFASSTNAVVPVALSEKVAGDVNALAECVRQLCDRAEQENARDRSVRIAVTGVPVHTALTAGRCRTEIGYLTWFSLAFIGLLAVFVFRSFRWIPLLGLSLVLSAGVGFAAVFLAFDSVHIMTLVFGTTVLGLVVDYSFHWLLSPARLSRQSPLFAQPLVRNLLVSWVTTEISFLPLMLSSVAVLRQTAVFLATALATALAFVLSCYPRSSGTVPMKSSGTVPMNIVGNSGAVAAITGTVPVKLNFFGCIVVFLSLLMFALTVPQKTGTDPRAIYRPPAQLAEADRIMAEMWGQSPEKDGGLTHENIGKLYAEWGGQVSEALGIEALKAPVAVGGQSPEELLRIFLERLTREALVGLAIALALMLATLAVIFRLKAIRRFLPSLIAILGMFGLVAVTGETVNLFHLLAMFLLAGMSIDYTVFLHSGGHPPIRPVVCSLLTSVAGFGALGFVSFPVVRAFGLVLGAGLPTAFLAAVALRAKTDGTEDVNDVETAASPLGMEILWFVYRILGLRALHFMAAAVGLAVWFASPRARRASPSRRKLVNFTRSLADKLVVMAEGRELPRVTPEGDADEFIREVKGGKGVFVLSSHVGTIEVLSALDDDPPRFHAWMDVGRTSAFNGFYLRHAKERKTVIHDIAAIGMETAFEAGEWLERGECLVMAGDRGAGAFRFAHAMGHPVYFVCCLAADGGYRAVVRRLPDGTKAMKEEYFRIRGELAAAYPEQEFVWNA